MDYQILDYNKKQIIFIIKKQIILLIWFVFFYILYLGGILMKKEKHTKLKKDKNILINILTIICIIAVIFSLYNISAWIFENRKRK